MTPSRSLFVLALLALVAFLVPGVREWIALVRGEALKHLGFTLVRLLPPLVVGTLLGWGLGYWMRRSVRLETLITPWLLILLALPWVLIIAAINIIPYLGVNERTIFVIVTLILTAQLAGAIGRSKQPDKSRAELLRRGFRLALLAVMVAEVFSRKTGIGAEFRFYSLYWSPNHAITYVLLALLLWGLVEGLSLILSSFLKPKPTLKRSPG